MTICAIDGHGKDRVIDLGATPGCRRFMTTLAIGRGGNMPTGFASGRCTVVAARAIARHRHIGVQFSGQPVGVTALVARGAIVRGRDVVAALACRRLAIMATGAIGRRSKDCMVDLGPRP